MVLERNKSLRFAISPLVTGEKHTKRTGKNLGKKLVIGKADRLDAFQVLNLVCHTNTERLMSQVRS